jgi:hypothetical protein
MEIPNAISMIREPAPQEQSAVRANKERCYQVLSAKQEASKPNKGAALES